MLAKSTRRSPWLVGICAEVARHRSLIALRAAPRRGSSHKTPALTARGSLSYYSLSYYSLSYYSLIWAGYTRGVAPQGPEYILASDSFTPAPLSLTPKHFLMLFKASSATGVTEESMDRDTPRFYWQRCSSSPQLLVPG